MKVHVAAMQNEAALERLNCRQPFARGFPSAALATQNETEVLQVSHLLRKSVVLSEGVV